MTTKIENFIPTVSASAGFLKSTTSQVAQFISRNRWLLLGAIVAGGVAAAIYFAHRISNTPTKDHVPKGLVSTNFKWNALHEGTTIVAAMEHIEDIKQHIDRKDLKEVINTEFGNKVDYCPGKNVVPLTLYFMICDEIIPDLHKSYVQMALVQYIQYAADSPAYIVKLLQATTTSDEDFRKYTEILEKHDKLTQVYQANIKLQEKLIASVNEEAFASLYDKLSADQKSNAVSHLIQFSLNPDKKIQMDLEKLLENHKNIKKDMETPLLYAQWDQMASKSSAAELHRFYTELPAEQKPQFYAKLTPQQQSEIDELNNPPQGFLTYLSDLFQGFSG
ncbi:MAG TPA: hypothetical protein PLO43_02970 [Chlamydiales bacterium]|nr:hypothetical protein [Chlamydiales bacterium]HPE85121.1 hypothetical protein [Chlamydiales bacterium]